MTMENGLSFKLSVDGNTLLAVVVPCVDKIELTSEIIRQRIKITSFSDLFLNAYLISELVERYNGSTTEEFEFEIGERRDASCIISISEDEMKAHFSLTPNFGGCAMTFADVEKALENKGITFGIAPIKEIQEVLAQGICTDFLIAEGLEPVAGVDAKFLSLIPSSPARQPLINAEGSVDYRELGDILIVHKGDVLMQRIPPIEGEAGRNILGETVPPDGGLDIPFSDDKRGIYVNPEDNNQLLSAITGQPIVIPNGIVVSPVLTLKNVDLSTGHIRFDGSVVVQGNVEAGMKIYALEDVTVDGDITNAQIECNGSLVIDGSVIGNSELVGWESVAVKGGVKGYKDKVEGGVYTGEEKRQRVVSVAPKTERRVRYPTRIASRGSVCVNFAEHFTIEAGIDIVINQYSMNNNLMAANKIVVGSKGKGAGKKSSIAGGITWAMMYIKAITIGSKSGIKTSVQAGSNPYIQRRITEIKNILAQYKDEQVNIYKILAWLTNHPEKTEPEMLARLHHTLSKLIIDTEMYQAELQELISNVTDIDNAKIIAERNVYTGAELKINKAIWKADENRGKSVFTALRRKMSVTTR